MLRYLYSLQQQQNELSNALEKDAQLLKPVTPDLPEHSKAVVCICPVAQLPLHTVLQVKLKTTELQIEDMHEKAVEDAKKLRATNQSTFTHLPAAATSFVGPEKLRSAGIDGPNTTSTELRQLDLKDYEFTHVHASSSVYFSSHVLSYQLHAVAACAALITGWKDCHRKLETLSHLTLDDLLGLVSWSSCAKMLTREAFLPACWYLPVETLSPQCVNLLSGILKV